eukprot:6522352-Pyramimonas_sp.AAC.1
MVINDVYADDDDSWMMTMMAMTMARIGRGWIVWRTRAICISMVNITVLIMAMVADVGDYAEDDGDDADDDDDVDENGAADDERGDDDDDGGGG